MYKRQVLITGVGRRCGIAAGIAVDLAQDGWDVALNHWTPYDARLGLVQGASDPEDIAVECRSFGVHADVVAGDLSDPGTPSRLIDAANARGDLRALVPVSYTHLDVYKRQEQPGIALVGVSGGQLRERLPELAKRGPDAFSGVRLPLGHLLDR